MWTGWKYGVLIRHTGAVGREEGCTETVTDLIADDVTAAVLDVEGGVTETVTGLDGGEVATGAVVTGGGRGEAVWAAW